MCLPLTVFKLFIDHQIALFYENKLEMWLFRTTLFDSEAMCKDALSADNPAANFMSSVRHLLSRTLAEKSTSVTASSSSWALRYLQDTLHNTKQFGTCDAMSIPTDRRQMLLLFCHFNISRRFGIHRVQHSTNRMSDIMRTLRKEHHISYKWQSDVMDFLLKSYVRANTNIQQSGTIFYQRLSDRNIDVHKYWALNMHLYWMAIMLRYLRVSLHWLA